MAKKSIPDPLERRHLLEKELDAPQALAIAEAYLAEERGAEAIAFLAMAKAEDRLAELISQAADAGDAFLLRQVATALGREPSADEWSRTALAAEDRGFERYASTARRQIEPEEA